MTQTRVVVLCCLLLVVSMSPVRCEDDEEEYEDSPWDEQTEGGEEKAIGGATFSSNDQGEDMLGDDPNAPPPPPFAVGASIKGTIMEFVDNGDWEAVKRMVASGKHSPQVDALKALLTAGANINTQDADGCTPLVWAVHNNHFTNAKILLDAGSDVSLVDKKGRTVKDHAISQRMRALFAAPGEVPESTLRDVDAATFKKEVEENDSDVVVYLYTPTCGYCREFAPVYDELAAGLRRTSITFLKMDLTKGEPPKAFQVASLPALALSKKKPEDGESPRPDPVFYDGDRSVKDLIKWIQRSATNKIMFSKGGKEAEAPESFEQEVMQPNQASANGAPRGTFTDNEGTAMHKAEMDKLTVADEALKRASDKMDKMNADHSRERALRADAPEDGRDEL